MFQAVRPCGVCHDGDRPTKAAAQAWWSFAAAPHRDINHIRLRIPSLCSIVLQQRYTGLTGGTQLPLLPATSTDSCTCPADVQMVLWLLQLLVQCTLQRYYWSLEQLS
jgi:hypothetical protein